MSVILSADTGQAGPASYEPLTKWHLVAGLSSRLILGTAHAVLPLKTSVLFTRLLKSTASIKLQLLSHDGRGDSSAISLISDRKLLQP